MIVNTLGLSRKEHVVAKLERGESLVMEERVWALELLSQQERDALRYDPPVPPGMSKRAADLYDLSTVHRRERNG